MDKFKNFGNSITSLISGNDLNREQTKELFSEILNNKQSDIHQGAFLAAITAKGLRPEEIAGAWDAIYDIDTAKVRPHTKQPVVDNCGTGMDSFKTFNISTASAIVAAAGGVCLARHGARAVTSRCGTVDICETLGVDMECPVETVKTSIEKTGIGLFNAMSPSVHPQSLFRILSQMSFGSILNIAASLANPVMPEYGVRGVYAKEMISPVVETMKEIGFKKAMVFYGSSGNGMGGMDELSPISESWVAELSEDGNIEHYVLSPEILDIRYPVTPEEIAGGNHPEKEALRLLKVFTSKDKKALYETICLNAAPIFYVAGKTTGINSGIEKSREIIASGKAMHKLKEWIATQHREPETGKKQLEHLMQKLD
ncbi:MAG: anthranilate phosphoribosyltransferase [Deltaproteobacteria bacterium]|nr:anthranilate phosphoribosyltransferase [Deltaproteobacteria bacterium]